MPDCQSESEVQNERQKAKPVKALGVGDCDYMRDVIVFAVADLHLNECDLQNNRFTHIVPMIRISYLQVAQVIPA